jgi:hypothetical protein
MGRGEFNDRFGPEPETRLTDPARTKNPDKGKGRVEVFTEVR